MNGRAIDSEGRVGCSCTGQKRLGLVGVLFMAARAGAGGAAALAAATEELPTGCHLLRERPGSVAPVSSDPGLRYDRALR